MSATKKFLENIKKHQETKKTKRFNGFLEDYLKLGITLANLTQAERDVVQEMLDKTLNRK